MMDATRCQVGDKVELMITGVVARYYAECVFTQGNPDPGAPAHDHPRFRVTGIWDKERGLVTAETDFSDTVLKPGDYILVGPWDEAACPMAPCAE